MLVQAIMLKMQQKIGQARSFSSIYYILQGKPSIQTIQDTHLFGLERYFGILKSLKKADFMHIAEQLVASGRLQKNEQENHYIVTESGLLWIEELNIDAQYHFNGFHYREIDHLFLMRLQLLIQVWTNANQRYFTYIPMIEHKAITTWVKQFYRRSKGRIYEGLAMLYGELQRMFSDLPERDASIWVSQLTGYKQIGKTYDQLAMIYGLDKADIELQTVHVTHYIIMEIEKNPSHFPLLAEIFKGLKSEKRLTGSAARTNTLLDAGFSPEAIAQKRQLKVNTIYDHIVEIALIHPCFPLDEYVTPEIQQRIYDVLQSNPSRRLKELKEKLPADISYFQIRLVLNKI